MEIALIADSYVILGFDFDDASDKFREKLEYATTFSIGDLTSMCNILGLDYIGAKKELQRRVIQALVSIKTLVPLDDVKTKEESEEKPGERQ